jgi:hypothetical protein
MDAQDAAGLPPDMKDAIREGVGIDLDDPQLRRFVVAAKLDQVSSKILELELRLSVAGVAERETSAAQLRLLADRIEAARPQSE